MAQFNFDLSCESVYKDEKTGKKHVVAKASDDGKDVENERMAKTAQQSMARQATEGSIDLLPEHKATFGIGQTFKGWVEKKDGFTSFIVDFELDDRFPESEVLFEDVRTGENTRQLSVGGNVHKDNIEWVSDPDGSFVRQFNDIDLDHVALTRKSRAAVPRTKFLSAISKSLDGDEEIQEAGRIAKERLEKDPAKKAENPTMTQPDPIDGHVHFIDRTRLDIDGNGILSPSFSDPFHTHRVVKWIVESEVYPDGRVSTHGGYLKQMDTMSGHGGGLNDVAPTPTPMFLFSTSDDKTLPSYVRTLKRNIREMYVSEWGRVFESLKENPDEAQQRAFIHANAVLSHHLKNIICSGECEFDVSLEHKSVPWSWAENSAKTIQQLGGSRLLRLAHVCVSEKEKYHYPHHNLVDGKLRTFFSGVEEAAKALLKNEENLPGKARSEGAKHLIHHYEEFDETPPSELIELSVKGV